MKELVRAFSCVYSQLEVKKWFMHNARISSLWMHAESLGSTQAVRVALGCRCEQLLRFFHAVQTFRVHPKTRYTRVMHEAILDF